MMKGSIKTRDLREFRPHNGNGPDRRQIVRDMQGRERRQTIKSGKEIRRHQFGPVMVRAAMHHAMADRNKPVIFEVVFCPADHRLKKRLKVGL